MTTDILTLLRIAQDCGTVDTDIIEVAGDEIEHLRRQLSASRAEGERLRTVVEAARVWWVMRKEGDSFGIMDAVDALDDALAALSPPPRTEDDSTV